MLESNRIALEEHYKKLWDALERKVRPDCTKARVQLSKNGEKAVCYLNDGQEVWLNSRYNPSAEVERFMEDSVGLQEEAVVCFFGMANGMYVREIRQKAKHDPKVVVYEPSIDIFLQVIDHIDISDLLEDNKVLFAIEGLNEEEFQHFLYYHTQQHNRNNNQYIPLPKYAALFPAEYEMFARSIRDSVLRLQAQINTVSQHGEEILRNILMNTKYFKGCRNGKDFEHAFPEDLTAILVSAGPSLKKNIHLLKEAKGKALIAVVDRTIRPVLELGVVPDMIFTIDYLKDSKMFEVDGIAEIPFVSALATNYRTLDLVRPKNFIVDGADEIIFDKLFKKEGSEIWRVDGGGSVATTAIANLVAWGFKRIILIGQDLAMTGNVEHFGESQTAFDDSKISMSYVEGIEEEKVLTRQDFLAYIRWIERIAYNFRDVQFIDSTEGGARKKGTTVMPFREAIDRYLLKEYDVASYIEKVPRLFTERADEKMNDLFGAMRENMGKLKRRLKEGVTLCRQGIKILESGSIQFRELKSINDKIGKIDEYMLGLDEYSTLEKLTAGAEYDFSGDLFSDYDDDRKEAIRMYEKSQVLYEKIAEKIPVLLGIVDEAEKHLNAD